MKMCLNNVLKPEHVKKNCADFEAAQRNSRYLIVTLIHRRSLLVFHSVTWHLCLKSFLIVTVYSSDFEVLYGF